MRSSLLVLLAASSLACGSDRTAARHECSASDLGACTYAYVAWSDFGACSNTCGTGTQTRTRTCRRSDGDTAECASCGGACSEDRSCTSDAGCTYAWSEWSAFGACSTTCGTGTQTRTRTCQRSDAAAADCARCGGACSDSQGCTAGAGCPFAYAAWSDWGECVGGSQTRTRSCAQEGGTQVDCAKCGGECSETRACVACSTFGVNVVMCAPTVPGDPAACAGVLQTKHDECVAQGCAWNGPTVCAIGGSVSNASCYGGTASCL